jgi:hypothetical protein
MSTNNTRQEANMSQFSRQVAIRDVHGNTIVQTVVDRNAAHTEARRLSAERTKLRSEYLATMTQFVVLAPNEQAELGYYGRVYGYQGDLGTTDKSGWCWLTFPEWREVVKATRRDFAADDANLAVKQTEAKRAAFARR